MGVHPNISFDRFPKQDTDAGFCGVGARVLVCFNYDAANAIGAEVVRSDTEEPGLTIFKLDDGRYVLSRECMWTPSKDPAPHSCPACPIEARDIGATLHNLVGQLTRNEPALQPRSVRKLADAKASLERWQPIVDAHFAAQDVATLKEQR